jgi:hypothetical protein
VNDWIVQVAHLSTHGQSARYCSIFSDSVTSNGNRHRQQEQITYAAYKFHHVPTTATRSKTDLPTRCACGIPQPGRARTWGPQRNRMGEGGERSVSFRRLRIRRGKLLEISLSLLWAECGAGCGNNKCDGAHTRIWGRRRESTIDWGRFLLSTRLIRARLHTLLLERTPPASSL